MVWRSDEPNIGSGIGVDYDILYARSTDNGATWSAPSALNTNADSDSGSDYITRVATDGNGTWIAAWHSNESNLSGGIGTDYDILCARSPDNGATWSAPSALNTNAGLDSGNDLDPFLAADGNGAWVATWSSTDDLGGTVGTDGDILYAASTDDGANWSVPVALNTNAGTDSGNDNGPNIASDGNGTWIAAWNSWEPAIGGGIGTDADILYAVSTDDGSTWSAPAALNTNADMDTGADYGLRLATDGIGTWLAVWDSREALIGGANIGTDPDILYVVSTDNGATWSAPAALNTNAGADTGSDYGPHLATDGNGTWLAAWYSEEAFIGGANIGMDMDILFSLIANVSPVTCGSTFEIDAALVEGLPVEGLFMSRPKVYAAYTHPLTDKPGKATVKVLTKIDKENGNATISCEWTKKLRLFDKKAFKASEAGGVGAATWITGTTMHDLAMDLRLASKEAPDQSVPMLGLTVPVIDNIADGGVDEDGNQLLVITGTWFGSKLPKVWREYVIADDAIKRQAMKVAKPTEVDALLGFKDSKGKPSYMNTETGESKVVVIVPAKEPGGVLNGTIVVDNGVGMAAVTLVD